MLPIFILADSRSPSAGTKLPSGFVKDYNVPYDPPDDEFWEPETVEIPINGELDLHTFRPAEVKELLPDYLMACRERGILQVRVVHGKGKGVLRRGVQALLERLPYVRHFELGGQGAGSWGATLVELEPLVDADKPPQT